MKLCQTILYHRIYFYQNLRRHIGKFNPQSKNLFHWTASYSLPAVMPNSSATDCDKEVFDGFRRL